MLTGKVYYTEPDKETIKTKNFILLYVGEEGVHTVVSLDTGRAEMIRLVQSMLQVSLGFMRDVSGSPIERQ